jgi:hypothetical protein
MKPELRKFYLELEIRSEFYLILAQKSVLTQSKGGMKEFTVKSLGKSSIKINYEKRLSLKFINQDFYFNLCFQTSFHYYYIHLKSFQYI